MTLRVLPEALVEIDETIAYYEEQQPGLRALLPTR